jgi:hypothetical protein
LPLRRCGDAYHGAELSLFSPVKFLNSGDSVLSFPLSRW